MSKPKAHYRFWGLDLLRALAISLVMLAHAFFFSNDWAGFEEYFFWAGVFGVELFFALSGFLIGRILLKLFLQEFSFREVRKFWIRRWLRTLPNYYFILGINLVAIAGLGGLTPQYLQYFGFIQNFSSPHPAFFSEAWSLSIEEWFYLLVPLWLLSIALFSKNTRKIHLFKNSLILLLVGQIVFRYLYILYSPELDLDSDIRKVVIFRLDAPLWGVLAGWVYHFHQDWWKTHAKMLFGAGCSLLVLGFACFNSSVSLAQAFAFTFLDLGFVCWLPLATQWKAPSNFTGKAINHISLISYSLYLTHMQFVFKLVSSLTNWLNWWQLWLVYFLTSVLLASILYKCIEQPVLRWRDRRFKQ